MNMLVPFDWPMFGLSFLAFMAASAVIFMWSMSDDDLIGLVGHNRKA